MDAPLRAPIVGDREAAPSAGAIAIAIETTVTAAAKTVTAELPPSMTPASRPERAAEGEPSARVESDPEPNATTAGPGRAAAAMPDVTTSTGDRPAAHPGGLRSESAAQADLDPTLDALTATVSELPKAADPSQTVQPGRRVEARAEAVSPGAPAAVAAPARAEAPVPTDRPAATPVVPPNVPEQIVSAVVPLHGRGDGRHEVTLELRPDDLGAIRVEVSVEHQTVHLTLHAVDPATSRLLAAALPDLRSALAEAGLTAGHVGVGPDGGGGAGERGPSADGKGSVRHPARPGRNASPGTSDPVRTARPAAAGRLDLFL